MNDKAYQQDIKSAVLLNTFQVDKKSYRVFYNNETLIWEKVKAGKSEYRYNSPLNPARSMFAPSDLRLACEQTSFTATATALPSSRSRQSEHSDTRCRERLLSKEKECAVNAANYAFVDIAAAYAADLSGAQRCSG
jgi:hypothetical protein